MRPSVFTLRLSLLLTLLLGSSLMASDPVLNWAPKTLPLPTIKQRARFALLRPRYIPAGYSLHNAQIVWASADTKLPARQAVHLLYRTQGSNNAPKSNFSILQAKHVVGRSAQENIYEVFFQGYFGIPAHAGKEGTRICFGTAAGVDFAIISTALSEQQISGILASMTRDAAYEKPPPTTPTAVRRRGLR